MKKYYHGSKDSLDKDVYYVFDSLPSFNESKTFCCESKDENRNIIVIKDGIVVDCYKGTCDEIQNSLLVTYHLHNQEYPLVISEKVDRLIMLKCVRVTRCILSHFTKTSFRKQVKEALQSYSWARRLEVLSSLDLSNVEYGKNSKSEVRKVFAFQLGQILGLFDNIELYTKSEVSDYLPELRKYLYREDCSSDDLVKVYLNFLEKCKIISFIQDNDFVYFHAFKERINLKDESFSIR